jgi:hypothetical protein
MLTPNSVLGRVGHMLASYLLWGNMQDLRCFHSSKDVVSHVQAVTVRQVTTGVDPGLSEEDSIGINTEVDLAVGMCQR